MSMNHKKGSDLNIDMHRLGRTPNGGARGKKIVSGGMDELYEAVGAAFQADSENLEMLEKTGVVTSTRRQGGPVAPELQPPPPGAGYIPAPIVETAGARGNEHVQREAPPPGRGWPGAASPPAASPVPPQQPTASPAAPQAVSEGSWAPAPGVIVEEIATQKFFEITAVGQNGVVISEPATGVKVLNHADLLNYRFMGRKSGS